MRRCLWISLCIVMQIQGAWLLDQYRAYANPYLKVVCEKEMAFHDKEIHLVERADVWKGAGGVKLRVPDPMKPEYHIYTDQIHSVTKRLLRDPRVISVSYRRFVYVSFLKKMMGMYFLEWIGTAYMMMESIQHHIPEKKKKLLQMMGYSVPAMMRKCAMGFTVSSFLAFIAVFLMIHGKIIDSVPIGFCGIIGLVFAQMGNVLEIIYLHR